MIDRDAVKPLAEGPAAPAGLPVLPPFAALIEVLVLVVLPGALDVLVPAFPSINESQPHFFWLPVLLLTLQYGSASGLLAAGAAIVVSTLLGWPEQEIGENHFSYLLRIWLQPVLWLATAVILGQLRLRQIERKEALGRAVDDLTAQRQSLAAHAQALRDRCDRLERIVATRRQPDTSALLAALGRVQANDAATATRSLGEALDLGFGNSPVSIYVVDDGAVRLAHRHAPAGASPAPAIRPEGQLYRALVTEHRSLTALDPGAEHELEGLALAAVPFHGLGDKAGGFVLLEGSEPDALDADTLHRLAAIAGVVAGRLRPAEDIGGISPAPRSTASRAPAEESPWRRARWQSSRHRASAARTGRKG